MTLAEPLLSKRAVATWLHEYRPPSRLAERYDALVDQVARLGEEGLGLAVKFDGLQTELQVEAEDELLLLVGTLLVRNGQRQVWNKIYDLVTETKGQADCFLTSKTAAVRHGTW